MRHRGRGLQRVRVRVGLRVRDRGRGRVRDKARIRVKVRVRVRRRFSFTVVTKEDSLCPESRSGLGCDTLWLRWLSPLDLGCSRRRVAARLALRSVPPERSKAVKIDGLGGGSLNHPRQWLGA